MKELVSVLIPIIKPVLSELEKELLDHCVKALRKYSLIFVASETADLRNLQEQYDGIDLIRFNDKYFESDRSLDSLLLMEGFYERFNWCDFILIHRLDSWIVKDELHYWCKQGYDFLSADFMEQKNFYEVMQHIAGFSESAVKQLDVRVARSGISLRQVARCAGILKHKKQRAYNYRHSANLENPDALFWELETNRFFPELRKPTSIVRKRFSGLFEAGLFQDGSRDQLPFALTGLLKQNEVMLPYFD